MLTLENIEDALMADMLANITGLRTVATHEKEFDDQTLVSLMPRAPFALLRYGGTEVVETERGANGGSGMKKRTYYLSLGSESLRSKHEGKLGCYELMDNLRERYDGFALAVGDESITIAYDGDGIVYMAKNGSVIYGMQFSWTEE